MGRGRKQEEAPGGLAQIQAQPGALGPVGILGCTRLGKGMRLVHDHQIPALPEGARPHGLLLQVIDRGDHARQSFPGADPGGQGLLGDRQIGGVSNDVELEAELVIELLTPLLHEPGRHHNKHPADSPASHQLEHRQPCLDGLA
jgi:hypothetical protein